VFRIKKGTLSEGHITIFWAIALCGLVCGYQVLCALSVISGSLSPLHGAYSGCGWRNGLQICRVAANVLNKQSRTADMGSSFSLGVGQSAKNSSNHVTKHVGLGGGRGGA
jgi:hypothetical protein